MENEIDLQRVLGLLADEERFKVAAAVALGAATLEKITAMTGLDTSIIVKALMKLGEAGLVTKQETGYSFDVSVLQALSRDISKTLPKKPALTGLERFFKDGKLITYPKDQGDKMLVLEHIIGLFELNRRYTEKEVNEKLTEIHPDYASYRRYLVEAGLFAREHAANEQGKSAIFYWRVEQI